MKYLPITINPISFKLNLSLKKETCQFNVQMSKKATSKEASFSCHMISSESRDSMKCTVMDMSSTTVSFYRLRQKVLSSAFLCSRGTLIPYVMCLFFSPFLFFSLSSSPSMYTSGDGPK